VRVLLDTNVVVSAILFGGIPRQLLEGTLAGELDLVTSQPLLAELETVLTRKFEFPTSMTASIRAELEAMSELVEPSQIERVTRTVADDLVLATAVAGAAEVLITGDKELLGIGSYEAIPIQSPRDFADTLEQRN
jgi:uncharacterized protein